MSSQQHGRRPTRRIRSVVPLLVGLLTGVLGAVALVPLAAPTPVPLAVSAPAGTARAGTGPAADDPAAPTPTGPAGAVPVRLPACAEVVDQMTPRDRLAQRLMAGVDPADPAAAAETVRARQIGGIFIGGNDTALLTDQALAPVQAAARIPLAVAVDDEGGRVQRIDALDGELPSARRMAAELTPEQVRELARDRGRALLARGVTMNFAPTVDVGDAPAGTVIGDRSFGADPDDVTRYAGAFAGGQREAGLAVVLKHFPGHGHADGDSHQGRVTTPPLDELRRTDLRPYANLLATPDPRTAVMVGHLDVPGLTAELPSSLTPAVYDLLRGEYGFDGMVVTDDLGAMKAVTGTFTLPEAVLRALDAGADMALWSSGAPGGSGGSAPDRLSTILDGLEAALADGRLDAGANERAVARVLAAKGVCA